MSKLSEACEVIQSEIEDTKIDVNFDGDYGVQIHWNGVIRLDCHVSKAAKAISLFKQLEALGAAGC